MVISSGQPVTLNRMRNKGRTVISALFCKQEKWQKCYLPNMFSCVEVIPEQCEDPDDATENEENEREKYE